MAVNFEDSLPTFTQLNQTLNCDAYLELPQDWWVIVTDVVNSTTAIEEGRYRDVNAVGGSTIAAVVNAVKPHKFPYVFGGDGASFCVAPEWLEPIKKALKGCQELAHDGLNLELRVGLVPYSELKGNLFISRYQGAPNLTQYFFMGGGMEEADGLVKVNMHYHLAADTEADADFSGFECRWNQIPSAKEVTFSLLVKARAATNRETLELYQALLLKIDELMGDAKSHHPLNSQGLSLAFNSGKLKAEILTKIVHLSAWKKLKMGVRIRLENLVGLYWMKVKKHINGVDWGHYKDDLILNSDYQKLDDVYKTVMASNQQSLNLLLDWLEQAYQQGRLYYGCHQTHSAVITCLVAKTGIEHVHFVDAADGGYAMAAKQLKAQINAEKEAITDID